MRIHPSTAILLALSLWGYDIQSKAEKTAERAEVNSRNALARIPEIIDRLDRIEQRLGMH